MFVILRNSKTIIKYALIQLVGLVLLVAALIVLGRFIHIPTWVIITVLALWVVKDVVLFPKVWRAYASDDNSPVRELIGSEAIVTHSLDPVGYVKVKGELWKAEIKYPSHPALRGDTTRVVDVRGMTLIVERCDSRERRRTPGQ
jgi:membrane protein implicated in regulation of membrane protease activity